MLKLAAVPKLAMAALLLCWFTVRCKPAVMAQATVYYVATNGDDSGPGTLQQPWRTIAKANRELRPGDTVYIRSGTYDEIIEPARSGLEGQQITYARYQNEKVLVRGESDVAKIVGLHDRSYIVVDGLTLSYGHPPPRGDKRWPWVHIAGSAHHNAIRNCTIIREGDPIARWLAGHREFGIVINDVDHNTIEHNYITGVNHGILLKDGPQYNVIQYNTISSVGQSPIVVGSGKGKLQGNLIQYNLLEYGGVEDGIYFGHDTDLPDGPKREADLSNLGTIIRHNVIRYNNENAIDLKGAARVVIEDNIIYGNVGSSNGPALGWNRDADGTIARGAHSSSRDVIIRNNLIYDNSSGIRVLEGYKVYHNTVVANNRDYDGSNSQWTTPSRPAFWGIRQKETGDGRIAIQNNIVVGHNGVEAGLILTQDQEQPNYIGGNLYYNTLGVFFSDVQPSGEWDKLTFSQWQRRLKRYETVTGDERTSFVADPMFVNAPERPVEEHDQLDFRLQTGSPAIDAAGPLTRASSSGSGDRIRVEDAGYFYDGYGVTAGDLITIGHNDPVRVIAIDYDASVITLDQSLSWKQGDWVTLPYDGSAPDIGAYEFEGERTLVPSGSVTRERVKDGLQALYTFTAGKGTTIPDVSGVGGPLDLKIEDRSAVQWLRNAIKIEAPTRISSAEAATEIVEACRTADEVTVEAWIKPANATQDGPARIVTLSASTRERNLTLGQGQWGNRPSDLYDIRLRTTERSRNGQPSLTSLPGLVLERPSQLVYSRDETGLARLYVNGELHAREMIGGSLDNWDESYPLVLGNEPTGERPWLGEFYLVALYCRALNRDEIRQNYEVGQASFAQP
jgi:parallel beta-helix repeat protein